MDTPLPASSPAAVGLPSPAVTTAPETEVVALDVNDALYYEMIQRDYDRQRVVFTPLAKTTASGEELLLRANVWKVITQCSLSPLLESATITKDVADKLNDANVFICRWCFDTNGKALMDCFITISKVGKSKIRSGNTWNSANGNLHMSAQHQTRWAEFAVVEDAKAKSLAGDKSAVPSSRNTLDAYYARSAAATAGAPRAASGFIAKDTKLVQTLQDRISCFATLAKVSEANIRGDLFVNDILCFCIDNARSLRLHKDELKLGRFLFNRVLLRRILFMETVISANLEETRNWFVNQTGHQMKFITIAHDGMEKRWKSRLGASLHFCNPTRSFRQIDVGMMVLESVPKSAAAVASKIQEVAKSRYGITPFDIYSAENDNTNSAVAAGRMIAGSNENNNCHMHTTELVLGHALGMKTRTKSGRVIDSNVVAEAIRTSAQKVCVEANGSGNKKYKTANTSRCDSPIKLFVPNDTRVGGIAKMYESMIRSYWALAQYHKTEKPSIILSAIDWKTIAEIYGTLDVLTKFEFATQTSAFGAIGMNIVMIKNIEHEYQHQQVFTVPDLKATPWLCTTAIRDIPTIQVTSNDEKIDDDTVKMMEVGVNLVRRIANEVRKYWTKRLYMSDLLAFALHPVGVSIGINYVQVIEDLLGYEEKHWTASKARSTLLAELKGLQKVLLSEASAHLTERTTATDMHEVLVADPPANPTIAPSSNKKRSIGPDSVMELVKRKKQVAAEEQLAREKAFAALAEQANNAETTDPRLVHSEAIIAAEMKKEVDKFFSLKIDWEQVCLRQGVPANKIAQPMDWENPVKVAKYVDVGWWWKYEGISIHQFKYLPLLAAKVLAKKGSNSFQERVFSRCSYLSDMHRQRLSKEKFEWQVLLAVNHDFLQEEHSLRQEVVKQIAQNTQDDASLREQVSTLLQMSEEQLKKDYPFDGDDEYEMAKNDELEPVCDENHVSVEDTSKKDNAIEINEDVADEEDDNSETTSD